MRDFTGGTALSSAWFEKILVVDKIGILVKNAHSWTIGGQLHGQKGNNPDELLSVPNC